MSSYSGYIVAAPVKREFTVKELEQPEPEVVKGPTLRHRDHAFGLKRWDEFVLNSPVPLADEPEESRQGYKYQLFLVRGFAKLIILAPRRRIVDYTLGQILDRRLYPNLRKVALSVDRMIEYCSKLDSPFLVTSLHGRFSGPTSQLKSMSLYGDDVTQSELYAYHHHLFNFHSAGLGRRPADGVPRSRQYDDGEIVRMANDGYLNLNITTRQRALELMDVVNFVITNRWVEDWVPVATEGSAWPT